MNIYETFVRKIEKERVLAHVPLKEHTTFRVGGECPIMVFPKDEEEIALALKICKEFHMPYFILGRGSNILIQDGNFNKVVIKLGQCYNTIQIEGSTMRVASGALLSVVAKEALAHNLQGIEFASGIPGTLGGAVVMNAGAYDGEIGSFIQSVKYLDKEGNVKVKNKEELDFGYRHSFFQDSDDIILEATLELSQGDPIQIKRKITEFTKRRNEKQPVSYPSAGSTFKRPSGHFAGALIEESGLKGLSCGGAQVSQLHAGFIINYDNACAQDIVDLIVLVQQLVYEHCGVRLETEVKIMGEAKK